MDEEILRQVEQILGYKFSNRSLLEKALTHSSAVDSRLLSNERLEFLGDAVLGVVICRTLFEKFPAHLEGDLTKIKSLLVSRKTCAKLARQLGLQKFLKIGKGMVDNRALSSSLAAGLFEAIIAAIYIDGGFEAAERFISKYSGVLIEKADTEQAQGNYKSLLQQYVQQQFGATPVYELLDEKGPDHDKCFESQVVINEQHFPSAWGRNKKEAEQRAAFNALVKLGVIEGPLPDHID
jgi:ribonuclease-3